MLYVKYISSLLGLRPSASQAEMPQKKPIY